MKATQKLHKLGQSLWIDNITRDLLNSGQLKHAIDEFSVTGLTFNPASFEHTIKNSMVYDVAIRKKLKQDIAGEDLFLELALEDLRHAADLLRPIYDQTNGMDGWVSLDVSPLLAHDTPNIFTAVKDLYVRARRSNLFVAIPGTKDNLPVVEEAILAGVPVNVTLLFSREHYLAAAEVFLRGIERRIAARLKPNVASVASLLIDRWDEAVTGKVPDALRNQLGIAIAKRTYKAYRQFLSSPRWERAFNSGARPQRLLWAGTVTRYPKALDVFQIKSLAAPLTVRTMSETTLKAFSENGEIDDLMPADGGDCEVVLSRFAQAGVDIDALATQLQSQETDLHVKSWIELMTVIASRSAALTTNQYIDKEKEAKA